MAREYRIELEESIDRKLALDNLAKSPYFHKPNMIFQEGEVWLTSNTNSNYPEVRLFPRAFGFFLEITAIPEKLSKTIESWIVGLRILGKCTIIDNDTEEEVNLIR